MNEVSDNNMPAKRSRRWKSQALGGTIVAALIGYFGAWWVSQSQMKNTTLQQEKTQAIVMIQTGITQQQGELKNLIASIIHTREVNDKLAGHCNTPAFNTQQAKSQRYNVTAQLATEASGLYITFNWHVFNMVHAYLLYYQNNGEICSNSNISNDLYLQQKAITHAISNIISQEKQMIVQIIKADNANTIDVILVEYMDLKKSKE